MRKAFLYLTIPLVLASFGGELRVFSTDAGRIGLAPTVDSSGRMSVKAARADELLAQSFGGEMALVCVIEVGGEPRPEAKRSLEKALQLEELLWVTSSKHQSIETFEPVIARPDVALVLLAIRWSSHPFGDVRNFCEQYGKPLVRLPAGYNANQVAAQVLAQASSQLGGGRN